MKFKRGQRVILRNVNSCRTKQGLGLINCEDTIEAVFKGYLSEPFCEVMFLEEKNSWMDGCAIPLEAVFSLDEKPQPQPKMKKIFGVYKMKNQDVVTSWRQTWSDSFQVENGASTLIEMEKFFNSEVEAEQYLFEKSNPENHVYVILSTYINC